jgi:hypothetical protein
MIFLTGGLKSTNHAEKRGKSLVLVGHPNGVWFVTDDDTGLQNLNH